jgi:hypothetical protein
VCILERVEQQVEENLLQPRRIRPHPVGNFLNFGKLDFKRDPLPIAECRKNKMDILQKVQKVDVPSIGGELKLLHTAVILHIVRDIQSLLRGG